MQAVLNALVSAHSICKCNVWTVMTKITKARWKSRKQVITALHSMANLIENSGIWGLSSFHWLLLRRNCMGDCPISFLNTVEK